MLEKADPNPAAAQGTCNVGEIDNSGGDNSGGDNSGGGNSASVGEWSVSEDNYLGVKIS